MTQCNPDDLRSARAARQRAREYAAAHPSLAFVGSVARLLHLFELRGPGLIRELPLFAAERSFLLRGDRRDLRGVMALLREAAFDCYFVWLEERLDPNWLDWHGRRASGAGSWLRVTVRDPEYEKLFKVRGVAMQIHRREGYARVDHAIRCVVAAHHSAGVKLKAWAAEAEGRPGFIHLTGGAAEAGRATCILRSLGQIVGFMATCRRIKVNQRFPERSALLEFRETTRMMAPPRSNSTASALSCACSSPCPSAPNTSS